MISSLDVNSNVNSHFYSSIKLTGIQLFLVRVFFLQNFLSDLVKLFFKILTDKLVKIYNKI